MRRSLCAAILVAYAGAASATEPACDRFAWNLDAERALLGGDEAGRTEPPLARRLALKPLAEAALPTPPERAERAAGGYAGHLTLSVATPGLYRVTLDGEGWIDVVQMGAHLKADAFTGIRGCPGIRKSVRFRLEPGPITIQVSGSPSRLISLAVTQDR